MCAGCNQLLGLDPPVEGADDAAALDAAATADAMLGRFGEPREVTQTATVIENDPILSDDGSEALYAVLDPVTNLDLYAAKIDAGVWQQGTRIAEISTVGSDGNIRFGHTDRTLYVSSDRAGTLGGTDIFVTTRGSDGGSWSVPEAVPGLNSPSHERTGCPCDLDRRFIFVSERDGAGWLYEAADGDDTVPLALSGAVLPRTPFLTADCGTLYFADGMPPTADLYVTTRAAPGEPWSVPVALEELNTTGEESDPWVSADGRHILFSRDGDIWEAFR